MTLQTKDIPTIPKLLCKVDLSEQIVLWIQYVSKTSKTRVKVLDCWNTLYKRVLQHPITVVTKPE